MAREYAILEDGAFNDPIIGTFPLLHIEDQKTAGSAGGASSVGSNTRDLNTVVTNEISGASLATNQIILPAGTYFIEASAPAFKVLQHQLKLYNTTDATDDLWGTSELASASDGQARSFISGRITIAGTKVFEIRHMIRAAVATNGLGAGDVTSAYANDHETFTVVKIWQVA